MIIDSAASFPAPRPPSVCASEIVSFHHTKPWGFGEGGCAIVDGALAEKLRSLHNFGVGRRCFVRNFAGNGKMSDICSSLDRATARMHAPLGRRVPTSAPAHYGARPVRRSDGSGAAARRRCRTACPGAGASRCRLCRTFRPRHLLWPNIIVRSAAAVRSQPISILASSMSLSSGMEEVGDAAIRGFFRALAGDDVEQAQGDVMTKPIVVVGAGRHGRGSTDILDSQGLTVAGFLDDTKPKGENRLRLSRVGRVCGDARPAFVRDHTWFVAIGDNQTRRDLCRALSDAGAGFANVVHPLATFPRGRPSAEVSISASAPSCKQVQSSVIGSCLEPMSI